MTIKRIRTVYFPVEDVGSSIKFYETALGLGLKFRDGDAWAEFRTGDASFALGSGAEAATAEKGAVVVFESDEMDALLERITRDGGRLITKRDMSDHGELATCCDPQGNLFQVLVKVR
jgi:predicted enzyme related to lactoylglutathione lyase